MEALPRAVYWVGLANGHRVLAHWRGKARRNPVMLAVGDRVRLEMTPFDLSKGAIIWNERKV